MGRRRGTRAASRPAVITWTGTYAVPAGTEPVAVSVQVNGRTATVAFGGGHGREHDRCARQARQARALRLPRPALEPPVRRNRHAKSLVRDRATGEAPWQIQPAPRRVPHPTAPRSVPRPERDGPYDRATGRRLSAVDGRAPLRRHARDRSVADGRREARRHDWQRD